ncbi:MAG TPA: hypothetical protein VKX25_17725 [Bryobacteraceae bacterium]|jgi:hypothetical protein|nr:hypothetical protein [Bryobacteraceae bacterium]
MRSRLFQKFVFSSLVILLLAVTALAQDYKSLLGKWNMTSETEGDPVDWTLVLKDDGGKLAAFLSGTDGDQAAKDFTYKDGVLKFQAPYQGEYYDVELKVKDGKLEGSWSGGGSSGRTTGVKAAE